MIITNKYKSCVKTAKYKAECWNEKEKKKEEKCYILLIHKVKKCAGLREKDIGRPSAELLIGQSRFFTKGIVS